MGCWGAPSCRSPSFVGTCCAVLAPPFSSRQPTTIALVPHTLPQTPPTHPSSPQVLLRTTLALLKTYEASIIASSHPAQLRKVLDTRAARLYDGESLMQAAFRGIGPMPGSMIGGLRAAATAAVDAQLAEQSARLEMLLCRTL